MLGEVRRGETGDSPVAVSTVLGWVLSGPAEKVPGHKLCGVNFNTTHVLRLKVNQCQLYHVKMFHLTVQFPVCGI